MIATSRLRTVLACAIASSLTVIDAQQGQRPPPPPTSRDAPRPASAAGSTISGRIFSTENPPRALRRVTVSLFVGRAAHMVQSDDEGRFMFDRVPAGRYTIATSKPGWLTRSGGAQSGGTTTTVIVDGRTAVVVNLTMQPGAVISGRVVDHAGQPQQAARPQVLRARVIGGRQVLSPVTSAVTALPSDDRGEYRIYGLPPGAYVVAITPASIGTGTRVTTAEEVAWAMQAAGGSPAGAAASPPPEGPSLGFAPVFYPGTTDSLAATPVTVAAGEERAGVDIRLSHVPMARVSGVVLGPDGRPTPQGQLTLMLMDGGAPVSGAGTVTRTSVTAHGEFAFGAVRPGQYRLVARGSSGAPSPGGGIAGRVSPADALYAGVEINVGGQDIDQISLPLRPAARVSGHLVFEPHALPPPDLSRVNVQVGPPLMAVIGGPGTYDVFSTAATVDGAFAIAGVAPGTYVLTSHPPSSGADAGSHWMVTSIRWRGQEVLDRVVEIGESEDITDVVITLSANSAEVAGTIVDGTGRPAAGYYLLVFPADRPHGAVTLQRYRSTPSPTTDGTFRIGGLPAGEYYLAALTEIDPLDVLDDAFLAQLAGASIKLTLRAGERKRQEIRLR